jgi:hypothetical protein
VQLQWGLTVPHKPHLEMAETVLSPQLTEPLRIAQEVGGVVPRCLRTPVQAALEAAVTEGLLVLLATPALSTLVVAEEVVVKEPLLVAPVARASSSSATHSLWHKDFK